MERGQKLSTDEKLYIVSFERYRGIISKDNWTPVKFTFSLAYDVSTAAPGNIRVHVHHFAIAG